MLELYIKKQTYFNEETEEFVQIEDTTLHMEHSLKTVRLWESKWHKPFMTKKEKTTEEILDYMQIMCMDDAVNPMIFQTMRVTDIQKVIAYIENPMTATWFSNNSRIGASVHSGEVVTAEIVYYWMFTLNVPLELETWHLNQLLTLLKVMNIKNGGEKKMSKKEAALQRAKLNAQRRKKYKSKG